MARPPKPKTERPTDRLDPDEQPLACPGCGKVFPVAPLQALASYVWRDGIVVGIPNGAMVCCQACGHCYCIGPGGPFARSFEALPLTPQRYRPPALESDDDGPKPPKRPPMPLGRKPPMLP